MSRFAVALALIALSGCAWVNDKEWDARLDLDEDGVPIPDDCDPNDPTIGRATSWYRDSDGDGYGDPAAAEQACEAPDGFVSHAEDCDDSDATIGLGSSWYHDSDGDGYGDPDSVEEACTLPEGAVAPAEGRDDCDDRDPSVYPGATELCDAIDQDCDGALLDPDALRSVSPESAEEPGVYTTIAAAIDAAQAASGGEVCVGPGVYAERLSLDGRAGDVQLIGALGSADTIIDAEDSGPALTIDGAGEDSLIEGFTLTGGDPGGDNCGGGLRILDSEVALRNLILTGNTASLGGGLCVLGGAVIARGLVVTDNEAHGSGGGVYVEKGSLALLDARLEGNTAKEYGGGLSVEDDGSVYGETISVIANHAERGGGAAVLTGATLKLKGARVWENDAINESGTGGAGGIYLDGNLPTLEASLLDMRANVGFQGGAIQADFGHVLLDTVILAGNENQGDGYAGAIGSSGGTLSVRHATLAGNRSGTVAGAVRVDLASGAISEADIRDSSVVSNESEREGGAIYLWTDVSGTLPLDVSYSQRYQNDPDDFEFNNYGSNNQRDCAPGFTVSSADPTEWDLRPTGLSCLVDLGDPDAANNDPDGSRGDIGAFGGPLAEDWPSDWP